ncbi:glycoside hydrolase family 71 protein [Tulasnella calospora MUT 4182]|uniref:Glycoside hydrolase family 71 protein n=1 Tax=Tulasnella calospora MUT 4182 TaxID=1051891 RepID=A0A0C3LA23_9AGAM|nr:glycoside hydrolase family 71 protein [Tulasnella calospora MUT 4182]
MVAHSHSLALFSLIPIILASPYRLDSPYAQGFRWLSPHRHRAATLVLPSGWSYTNCYSDPSTSRVLSTKIYSSSTNTQDSCVAQCNTQNYNYAGVEYGVECWCGNILNNPQVTTSCNMACPGDSTQKCGDGNKIGLFTKTTTVSSGWTSLGCFVDQDDRTLKGAYYSDSAMTPALCQSKCSTAGYSMAGTEYGTECYCGNSLSKNVGSSSCTSTCGGDSSQKCGGSWALNVIIAHVIVGNTYSYTKQQWIDEIKMASAQGIDAFALDFGYDSWQAGQMDSAYDAAVSSGTGFKMLLSLDFTVLSCSDNNIITTNIVKYKNHAAQLKDSSGNMWVQTFDGGNCRTDTQWNSVLRNNGINIKFVPAFFNDETNTKMKDMFPSINGDFLWGGAWPKGNNVLDWSEDDYRISRSGLSRPPDVYMTTVAPLFFVHYSGRNSIWRSDDHLYARRWEDLFSHRALVDAVQIVTWNDYGESTYIGPIGKDMPSGTTWVTGFDHTPFLQMTGYYAWAFKTGQYPTITSDKIFFWGRPHSKNAGASNDGIGKPTNSDWTSDNLWIVLFSTGSGSLKVTMGSSTSTFSVVAGVNKFTLGLAQASSVTAVLTRNGSQVFSVQGVVTYTNSPSTYNWNYAAAAGP